MLDLTEVVAEFVYHYSGGNISVVYFWQCSGLRFYFTPTQALLVLLPLNGRAQYFHTAGWTSWSSGV